MIHRDRFVLLGLVLLGLVGTLFWMSESDAPPSSETVSLEQPAPARSSAFNDTGARRLASDAAEPREAARRPAREASLSRRREGPEVLDAAPEDWPTLLDHPLSDVPHHVLLAWGDRTESGVPGIAGLKVIVDPNLPTAELDRLARDIRERSLEAGIFHARIYDSEGAATYDRHTDGGARAERHQVAVVTRNTLQGLDVVKVRGVQIQPEGG